VRYLLDTNIVSGLVRDPHGRITQRMRKVGEMQICTSILVAAELRYGTEKKGHHALLHRISYRLVRKETGCPQQLASRTY
jgi:Predicted nucleic acid-binding protein, contains PIN domain